MRMKPFRRIVRCRFAVIASFASLLLAGGCAANDALEQMFRADAEAIRADKARIDLDAGNPAALARDLHQLYADTEKQESDRDTEDDEFQEGPH